MAARPTSGAAASTTHDAWSSRRTRTTLHDGHDEQGVPVQYQKSLTPDRPFFMYFAPGATHAPHHVPKEWIAKYKGRFDQGWDVMRKRSSARRSSSVWCRLERSAPKPDAIRTGRLCRTRRSSSPADGDLRGLGESPRRNRPAGRCHQGPRQLDNTLVSTSSAQRHERRRQHDGLFNEMTSSTAWKRPCRTS